MKDNKIEFKWWGPYALFTDPITKIGGEKFSYQIPTYEAVKGAVKNIYWKPTISWIIDEIRVMKPIKTFSKGIRTLNYTEGGADLFYYTYLVDVEYQVRAHFEWNEFIKSMEKDRIEQKHTEQTQRFLKRGGKFTPFLGTSECQSYIEPCVFGSGNGYYDKIKSMSFGTMFHGFDYPDDRGVPEYRKRFWNPVMREGVIKFIRPEDCDQDKIIFIKNMKQNFSLHVEEAV